MKISTKQIAQTAVLLALCIVFQYMKGISAYITGSAVNALLVLAAIAIGLQGGLIIAVVSPIVAYFLGATPVMTLIPWMIPVVMAGNSILVIAVHLLKKKHLIAALLTGAVTKAMFLWLTVWYAILPIFGNRIPEAKRDVMQASIKVTFSVTQLVTALIGCAIAWVVWRSLKIFLKHEA